MANQASSDQLLNVSSSWGHLPPSIASHGMTCELSGQRSSAVSLIAGGGEPATFAGAAALAEPEPAAADSAVRASPFASPLVAGSAPDTPRRGGTPGLSDTRTTVRSS